MRRTLLIPASVVVALLYATCDAQLGFRKWWQLRGELHGAEQRIASVERDISHLRREAAELEADDFALERAIREDLQLAREGETVVRLPSTGEPGELPVPAAAPPAETPGFGDGRGPAAP